jgi:hypothetical protein
LDYVLNALSALPRDPGACTQADLERLARTMEDFTRHTVYLRDRMAALEVRTRDGGADLDATLRDRADLERLEGRVDLARSRLHSYADSALKVHGIDLAALVGD